MFLSKLVLNPRDRNVQHDLGNVHKLHQRIMQAFPDEDRDNPRNDWHILFRQETNSDVLLVQSTIKPDWSYLSNQYVLQYHEPKQLDFETSTFPEGRSLLFRLRANPSKRDRQTKKTIGLCKRDDQQHWLMRQGDRHGFQIKELDIIPSANIFGQKEKKIPPIRIKTVIFQGILEVSNPELFMTAIQQGIGRGKSYGCGLLSLSTIPKGY